MKRFFTALRLLRILLAGCVTVGTDMAFLPENTDLYINGYCKTA